MLSGRLSTRVIPPVPAGFREAFIEGGWRKIERLTGARTALLLAWIDLSGGDELYRARAVHMQQQGRGAKNMRRLTAVKPAAMAG